MKENEDNNLENNQEELYSHEAMTVKKVENEISKIVTGVFQKGYLLNGRLIRPARVEVSSE